MAVTPADVAVELGRTAPESGSVTEAQWQSWINRALWLIGNRLGDVTLLDQESLDNVVTMAVARHVRNPDDATQVTYSTDDSSTSKTYRSSSGEITILDAWWALLDPDLADGANVGSTQLYGEADALTLDSWA